MIKSTKLENPHLVDFFMQLVNIRIIKYIFLLKSFLILLHCSMSYHLQIVDSHFRFVVILLFH